MKKTNLCLMAGLFLLFISSCSKDELAEPSTSFYKVRTYDDTLPDPRNHSIRIAAGNNRLFMTYGNTFERWIFVNGAVILAPPPQNVWMLTDNAGNLIKKDTFPSGLAMGAVLAMPDNSFLVITSIGDFATQGSYGGVQMMRLDPNGVMSSVDTLDLPTESPVMILGSVHLSLSQNGNALLYFLYQGTNGFGGSFIGEMDMQGNFLWYKEFLDYTITDCMAEPGGGYLMTGKIFDLMNYSSDAFIIKTNAVGDSIWHRSIDCVDIGNGLDNGVGQIIKSGDGNYRLSYCDWDANYHQQNMWVHEFNLAGEFMDTAVVPLGMSWMVQKGQNEVFLLNSIDAVYGNLTDRLNSWYAILDGELNLSVQSTFQEQTTDIMNSVCRTSDGKIACFGITQSFGKRYYKPQLLILD